MKSVSKNYASFTETNYLNKNKIDSTRPQQQTINNVLNKQYINGLTDKNQKNAANWLVDMKKLSKESMFSIVLLQIFDYDQNPIETQCSMGLRMKIHDKKNEFKRFYQAIGP